MVKANRDTDKPVGTGLLSRRAFLKMMGTVAAASALSGCSKRLSELGTDDALTTSGGTLRVPIPNPRYIEPYNITDIAGMRVCRALFDPLVTYDFKKQAIVPLACTAWDMDDQATTFTFSLRPDAYFHDGTPVTAQSFKYAWERFANPTTNSSDRSSYSSLLKVVTGYSNYLSGYADGIDGIIVQSDLELVVSLDDAYPDFIYTLTMPAFAPVPDAAADLASFARSPVGNGPFKMNGDWVDERYIKVIKDDSYTGDSPIIDGIDFLIFRDESTSYEEFLAGNLDFTPIPLEDFAQVSEDYDYAEDGYTADGNTPLLSGGELATYFLVMNMQDSALGSNVVLRHAISLCIDRDDISSKLTGGLFTAASGIIPPGVDGYRDGAWPDCRYSLSEAKSTLSSAGYPNGTGSPSIVLISRDDDWDKSLAAAIQNDLTAIGLIVSVETYDAAIYNERLSNGDYQIAIRSWMADYPTQESFLKPLFVSNMDNDISNYSDQAFDGGIEAALHTIDDEERSKRYQVLDDTLASAMPVIPIMYASHHDLVDARVKNFYYSPETLIGYSSCWLSE